MARDPSAFLEVDVIPARQGDCLLVEWGDDRQRPHRMLVDGGPAFSYGALKDKIAGIRPRGAHIDVLVVTHIDADHIEGVIKLLNDASLEVSVGDVWFNGFRHLPGDELGGAQGEMLGALISARELPWNAAFDGGSVSRPTGGRPPCVTLAGGLEVTVVAPTTEDLRALRPVWEKECRKAGITPGSSAEALAALRTRKRLNPLDSYLGEADAIPALAGTPTDPDSSAANRSSIALLLEYNGASALLTGDSTPTTLCAGLESLCAARGTGTLEVDLFKLPHHGSSRNVTKELLRLVRADTYVVSSDGSYFGHPDRIAMARLLTYAPTPFTIAFNHRNEFTAPWSHPDIGDRYKARAIYPSDVSSGIRLTV